MGGQVGGQVRRTGGVTGGGQVGGQVASYLQQSSYEPLEAVLHIHGCFHSQFTSASCFICGTSGFGLVRTLYIALVGSVNTTSS